MSNVERAYYDDGTLRAEGVLADGAPHGLHRHWHPNGVLAMEVPYDHGIIDGMVKQWNDKGKLVATSELKKGTGVLRTLHSEQGLDGEMTYVDGKLTGRQLTYFDDGELAGATYWLENEKVSKKRYLEACKQNPNLPRYEDEPQTRAKNPAQKKAVKLPNHQSQPLDELPLKLLQGPRVREALSWLEESRHPSRSLGEATGQDESIRLVKELYSLGAATVHAVEIDGGADEDQNTGRIVIELPQDKQQRENLLKFCGDLSREAGFDAETDLEQRYVLLMLD
jgi:hypothetical protein